MRAHQLGQLDTPQPWGPHQKLPRAMPGTPLELRPLGSRKQSSCAGGGGGRICRKSDLQTQQRLGQCVSCAAPVEGEVEGGDSDRPWAYLGPGAPAKCPIWASGSLWLGSLASLSRRLMASVPAPTLPRALEGPQGTCQPSCLSPPASAPSPAFPVWADAP